MHVWFPLARGLGASKAAHNRRSPKSNRTRAVPCRAVPCYTSHKPVGRCWTATGFQHMLPYPGHCRLVRSSHLSSTLDPRSCTSTMAWRVPPANSAMRDQQDKTVQMRVSAPSAWRGVHAWCGKACGAPLATPVCVPVCSCVSVCVFVPVGRVHPCVCPCAPVCCFLRPRRSRDTLAYELATAQLFCVILALLVDLRVARHEGTTNHEWRSLRFRLLAYTHDAPPRGVRVEKLTKSRE